MIDYSSRKMAAFGHTMIVIGILLPVWMIFFHQSRSLFERDKVEIAVPIIAACLLILGKSFSIPAALATGHDSALKTSLYCDMGGILVNVVLMAGVLPVTSGGAIGLLSFGASILGFIFFLNYLQGTAEHLGETGMAAIPGKLYRGCGLIFLGILVTFFSIFLGLAGLFIKLLYASLAAWLGAYLYLIGGTGYKMLQGKSS